MKIIPSLILLFAASSLISAQEENPFLKQTAKKAPEGEAGGSFLTLAEHILVPSDLLDSWLEGHSLANDASELRAAVQDWIADGKATLDFSALSAGIVGRAVSNESVLEQIYATEYEPVPEGEWPEPTSFETRNLGYEVKGDAIREQDQLVLRAGNSMCKMLPHRPWDRLAEEKRQPGDIFIPRFRSIEVKQSPSAGANEPAGNDPFASPRVLPRDKTIPSYPAGKIHLALRADDELPEPVVKVPKGDIPENENPPALAPDRPVRLIFFRGNPVEDAPASDEPLPEDYQVSMKLIQVDHLLLSEWLQERDLAAAARELNEAIEAWNQKDGIEVLRTLSGGGRNGTATTLDDIKEVIYPTEYEPGKRSPGTDGKPAQPQFANATSFETRNVGAALQSEIAADPGGLLMRLNMNRIMHGGYTIHHRIFRDGKWEPNITFPRFSSNRWVTTLRVKKGHWMLVGSGSAFGENGDFDPTRTVLAFVKVE